MKEPNESLWFNWSLAIGILGMIFVLPFTPFVTVHNWRAYLLIAPAIFATGAILYGLVYLRYALHGSKYRVLYYNKDGSTGIGSVNHFPDIKISRSSSDTWYWGIKGNNTPVNSVLWSVQPSPKERAVIGVFNVWTLGGVHNLVQEVTRITRQEKPHISAVS